MRSAPRTAAAASEAEVDHERALVVAARAAHSAAEQTWTDDVATWTTTGLVAAVDVSWDTVLNRLAARDGEPTWVAAVRQSVADALAPALREARQAATAADLAVAGAAEALAVTEPRLAEVEAQPEARPLPARYRDAVRDPAAGAPFYELVDVATGVGAAEAAGLEAALEAAGLLDAWVHADGLVVHPDTRDTLLRADATACLAGAATLADVLVPAPGEGSPVASNTIAAVLRAVGLGDPAGAAAAVSAGGRWSLGVLRGAWSKDAVEFIGAGARRATRERVLAELRHQVETRGFALAEARDRADRAAQRPRRRRSAAGDPAAGRDDRRGGTGARSAERTLAAAAPATTPTVAAPRTPGPPPTGSPRRVAHEALGDGLPTTVSDARWRAQAARRSRQVLADHRRALDDLARDHERWRGQPR